MPCTAKISGSIHLCGLILLLVDTGDGRQIDDGVPSQSLPLGQERLEPVHGSFRAQNRLSLLCSGKLCENAGQKAVCGKQRKCQGENDNPADEVRKSGKRLHELSYRTALDLIQQNGKDHGKRSQDNADPCKDEGIFQCPYDIGILHDHLEVIQPHKVTLQDRYTWNIVKYGINPSKNRNVVKQQNDHHKRQYHK